MMRILKIILSLFIIMTVVSIPLSVFPAEADTSSDYTDLEIKTETITQRQYAGTAVTDGYGIEILTQESYEQAQVIATKQERDYQAAQATLFSESDAAEDTDAVAAIAEQLGMFDESYSATDTRANANTDSDNTAFIVLALLLATGAGIAIAVVWQKRKG